MRTALALVLLAGSSLAVDPARGADDPPVRSVAVEGATTDLGETPIVVAVLEGVALAPGPYRLRGSDGSTLAATIYRDQDQRLLGFILPGVKAQAALTFTLEAEELTTERSGVAFVAEGRRIAVRVGGQPLTTYVPDDGPKPYFDPLFGPGGVALTRAYPMRQVAGETTDHPHHRSMWFAHQDVSKANTWDQLPGHGSIHETARPTVVGSGGPVGVLRTTNDWLDRDGKKVCSDERVVTFYATRSARVFDFDVTIRASAGPVTMGDNKDGTFAIRLADPLAVKAGQGGQIVTSRGLTDKAAWGQAAEWVDCFGPLAGATRGVAILNHPASFRHPTTWHVRDYGLFAANPFGWHDFGQKQSGSAPLQAGESLTLRHRVVLHDGDAQAADIAGQFRSYSQPPRVTIH